MTQTKLAGNPINLKGDFPSPGTTIGQLSAVKQDLSDLNFDNYPEKRKVLNIFPSVDTPVCAISVRTFNQQAAEMDNTVVLCLSADLPFAHQRFCGAEGIKNVETGSLFRNRNFAETYGLLIEDGPLKGLTARAVIVLDESNKVLYAELVDDITHEPDYKSALSAL